MTKILEALIRASERAANIARSCCSNSCNDTLIIAEKGEGEGNSRFEHDFKTIADVLAQEYAKLEITESLPDLASHFRGEECAEINGVRIEAQGSWQETYEMLSLLLPPVAAERMAKAAFADINTELYSNLPEDIPYINPNELGVWIDPIDATTEFIAGVKGEADAGRGLSCVTVLIGAYMMSSGAPVIGVINQPFFNKESSRILWGITQGEYQKWNGTDIEAECKNKIVLMSGAEKPDIVEKFKISGWEVKSIPGAGHKLLKVVTGEAAAYVVSKGTTFRWDTCGPHSILKANGGDLIKFNTFDPITYNEPADVDTQMYCNDEGIIAYKNVDILDDIKILLQ